MSACFPAPGQPPAAASKDRPNAGATVGPASRLHRPKPGLQDRHSAAASAQPDAAAAFAALLPDAERPLRTGATADPPGDDQALDDQSDAPDRAAGIAGLAQGLAAPEGLPPQGRRPPVPTTENAVLPPVRPGPAARPPGLDANGADISAMQSLLEGLAGAGDQPGEAGLSSGRDGAAHPAAGRLAPHRSPQWMDGPAVAPAGPATAAPIGNINLAAVQIAPASLPVDQPTLRPTPHAADVVIAQIVPHAGQASRREVEIELSPEGLGRVRFHILHQGDAVRVVLAAERSDTADLLRRNADQLAQEFRQSGLDGAQIDFAGWSGQRGDSRPSAPLIVTPKPPVHDGADTPAPPPDTPRPATTGLDLRL